MINWIKKFFKRKKQPINQNDYHWQFQFVRGVFCKLQHPIGTPDSHGDVIMPGAITIPNDKYHIEKHTDKYIIRKHYTAEETKELLDRIKNAPIPWTLGMDYDSPVRIIEEEIKPLKHGKPKT